MKQSFFRYVGIVAIVCLVSLGVACDPSAGGKPEQESSLMDNHHLVSEEIELVATSLGSFPTKSGILFLAPNAVNSPSSSERKSFSYTGTLYDLENNPTSVSIDENEFCVFVPLPANGTYFAVLNRVDENGDTKSFIKYELKTLENTPTICWLDYFRIGIVIKALPNIRTDGIRVNIESEYQLSTDNGTIAGSHFNVQDGFVDSIQEQQSGSLWNYNILVKSDYNGTESEKNFSLSFKPEILVDGKRSLGNYFASHVTLTHLTIPSLEHGQYRNFGDTANLETGYYFTRNPAFKVKIDPNYNLAGWDNENGLFFKASNVAEWPERITWANSSKIPTPHIVSDTDQYITACYIERDDENLAPLDSDDTVIKIEFNNALTTDDLSRDNFEVVQNGSSCPIENFILDDTGKKIEFKVTDYTAGKLSLLISPDEYPLSGQLVFNTNIADVKIVNNEEKGTVTLNEGMYLMGETLPIIVEPKAGATLVEIETPSVWYGVGSPEADGKYHQDIQIQNVPEDGTFTITTHYR